MHAACLPAAWLLAAALPGSLPWAWLEGVFAAVLGTVAGLAPWWAAINFVFMPALGAALAIDIPPAWALGAFMLTLLVYWSVARSQVPLFLSSGAAIGALQRVLAGMAAPRFLDIGCGSGRVVRCLAAARAGGQYDGIEHAPLPWIYAWLRARVSGAGCRVQLGDFWQKDLSAYDVVYAYLSPVPMARLWRKARLEMKPGALLISNSFAIPGAQVDGHVALNGGGLFIYRM